MSNTQKQTGTVKFFNAAKAYGFITIDGGGEVFVHKNDCNDKDLRQDDKVEFSIGDGKKGKIAQDVSIID